jgi:hypothetical protein
MKAITLVDAAQNASNMVFDCPLRNIQDFGNFAIACPINHQTQHFSSLGVSSANSKGIQRAEGGGDGGTIAFSNNLKKPTNQPITSNIDPKYKLKNDAGILSSSSLCKRL